MCRSCRGALRTGLLVCTFSVLCVPVFSAETTPSTNAAPRVRDDRSAALTLALQAVQQLQTQQRATLQAVEAARQQSEAAAQRVESLRHIFFAFCAVVTIAAVGVAFYMSSALSKSIGQGKLSLVFKCPLPPTARVPDVVLHVSALLARGQALLEQRHPMDALACFEQAITLDRHKVDAFIKKGAALERLGRLDEALASYQTALELDDSHADAYIGKGNVLNRLERYREALACFERASHGQHHFHTLPHAVSASH